jgi:hypothetical protein
MFKCINSFSYQMTLTLLIILCFSFSVFAKSGSDRVLKPMAVGDSPVDIVGIKVKSTVVEPSHKFIAEDDWLNGLTFTIRNVSDKPISYLDIELYFPAPSGSQVDGALHQLRYGWEPIHPNNSDAGNKTKSIMPGDTLDLTLSETEVQGVVSILLSHAGISTNVESVTYCIGKVFFEGDEDTMWSRGRLLRRDTNDPMRFNVREKYVLRKSTK